MYEYDGQQTHNIWWCLRMEESTNKNGSIFPEHFTRATTWEWWNKSPGSLHWPLKNLDVDTPMRTIGIVLAKYGDQSEIEQQNIGICKSEVTWHHLTNKKLDLSWFKQQ